MRHIAAVMVVACVCVLVWGSQARAWEFAEGWTAYDTTVSLAIAGVQYMDYRQTTTGSRHPDRYSEMNGILDKHPDQRSVDIYTVVSMVTIPLITALLPPECVIGGVTLHPRTAFRAFSGGAILVNWVYNKKEGLGWYGEGARDDDNTQQPQWRCGPLEGF